jgi:hypothetical protein
VQKHNSAGGRPKKVAEFIEGKPAVENFVGAMRQILSGKKTELQKSHHESRALYRGSRGGT